MNDSEFNKWIEKAAKEIVDENMKFGFILGALIGGILSYLHLLLIGSPSGWLLAGLIGGSAFAGMLIGLSVL